MSDPSNPYGATNTGSLAPYGAQADYTAQTGYPGAQADYGAQAGYGAQADYGAQYGYAAQAGYGAQYGYGAQAGYGQPLYGQMSYAINPAVERLRSNATTVRIMAFISLVTLGPLLAIPAWIWGSSLLNEAIGQGAPMDVVSDIRSARTTAMVCTIIQVVGLVLLFVVPFLLAALVGSSY